jgi:alpha-glucosidase
MLATILVTMTGTLFLNQEQDIGMGLLLPARDHARVPMQWGSSPNAGFSTAKPWMRVIDGYESINAAD